MPSVWRSTLPISNQQMQGRKIVILFWFECRVLEILSCRRSVADELSGFLVRDCSLCECQNGDTQHHSDLRHHIDTCHQ